MMPSPYSTCIEKSNIDTLLSREMAKIGLVYNRRNCLVLCQQKFIIDNFNCSSFYLPNIFNATRCNTSAQFLIMMKMQVDPRDCFEYCPYECESVYYDVSFTSAQFPSRYYYKKIIKADKEQFFANVFNVSSNENVTFDMISQSVVSFFIYFDQIRVLQMTESPTTQVVYLIANIGGTLGLFIGVSLLSFVELIELMAELGFILIQNRINFIRRMINNCC